MISWPNSEETVAGQQLSVVRSSRLAAGRVRACGCRTALFCLPRAGAKRGAQLRPGATAGGAQSRDHQVLAESARSVTDDGHGHDPGGIGTYEVRHEVGGERPVQGAASRSPAAVLRSGSAISPASLARMSVVPRLAAMDWPAVSVEGSKAKSNRPERRAVLRGSGQRALRFGLIAGGHDHVGAGERPGGWWPMC